MYFINRICVFLVSNQIGSRYLSLCIWIALHFTLVGSRSGLHRDKTLCAPGSRYPNAFGRTRFIEKLISDPDPVPPFHINLNVNINILHIVIFREFLIWYWKKIFWVGSDPSFWRSDPDPWFSWGSDPVDLTTIRDTGVHYRYIPE